MEKFEQKPPPSEQERRHKPFETFKRTAERVARRLKRAFGTLALGAVLLQGVEGAPREPDEARYEYLEKESFDIEQLYEFVVTDDHERTFLSPKGSGRYYEIGRGGKESAFFAFVDIESFANAQGKDVVDAHTHHIGVYDNAGYSQEELEQMRQDKSKRTPMPPSTVDLLGASDIFAYFEDKGIDVESKVVDATGEWSYRVKNEEAIKEYQSMTREFATLGKNLFKSLTEEEQALLKGKEKYLKELHQEKIIDALKADPETRAIGEKFEQAVIAKVRELERQYNEVYESLAELLEASTELMLGPKLGYSDVHSQQELVEAYKKAAEELGFEVSYTRFPK